MTTAPPTTAPAPTAAVCPYCDEPLPADTAPNRWDGCAACADWIEHAPDPPAPAPTYDATLGPDAVAQIVATAMCPKCALRRRRERLRRLAAQDAARQTPAQPAWDTRCVRGCGAVVLDAGDTCSACLVAQVDVEIAAALGKERQR